MQMNYSSLVLGRKTGKDEPGDEVADAVDGGEGSHGGGTLAVFGELREGIA